MVVPLEVQPSGAFKTREKLLAVLFTVTVPLPLLHVKLTVPSACRRGLLESRLPTELKTDGPSAEMALKDVLADFFCSAALPPPPPPHETITNASAATKIIFKLIM